MRKRAKVPEPKRGDTGKKTRTDKHKPTAVGVLFQELECSWREYDLLEADVNLAKSNLLEQLEALGSPQVARTHTHTLLFYTVVNFEQNIWICVSVCLQTEPPSQRHIQIQKELWRIQDVMEALSKSKPQRSTNSSEALPQHLHHHILTFLLACVCLMSWIQFQGSKQFL